jgi:hypothetical protein
MQCSTRDHQGHACKSSCTALDSSCLRRSWKSRLTEGQPWRFLSSCRFWVLVSGVPLAASRLAPSGDWPPRHKSAAPKRSTGSVYINKLHRVRIYCSHGRGKAAGTSTAIYLRVAICSNYIRGSNQAWSHPRTWRSKPQRIKVAGARSKTIQRAGRVEDARLERRPVVRRSGCHWLSAK